MILQINIQNFKGIRNLQLDCRNLTLLSGANGSGKSTVLQSLLLLIQSQLNKKTATISLNGDYVSLGTAGEIEYNWSEKSTIKLAIHAPKGDLAIEFNVALTDPRDVIEASITQSRSPNNIIKRIRYLSANRIAPSYVFPHSTNTISKNRTIGNSGEYTFAFLSKHGSETLNIPALIHPSAENFGVKDALITNVIAWMQRISPGITFKPEILQDIGLSKISYGYPGLGATPTLTPHNVGFGITNVLPIVTRILMSEPGDILLLENPEAHVHPRGQVEIGKLLAIAASNGIQIFLETHSDHIFNGIRLKLKDSINGFSESAFYYGERKSITPEKFETAFTEIKLTERGHIASAPVGFFDEWETSVMELL